jgi:hypothetical protein
VKRLHVFITLLAVSVLFFFVSCEDEIRIIVFHGQVAYYPFDGDIKDYSTNLNHGIDSTKGIYVNGVKGLAHDFNGKTDFIELSNTINFSLGLTFSFWINSRGFTDGENNGCVISKYSMSGNRSFFINSYGYKSTASKNEIRAFFFPQGYTTEGQEWVGSNTSKAEIAGLSFDPNLYKEGDLTPLKLNTWTHCVVNCTNTAIEIWIDGKLACSKEREHGRYFDSFAEPIIIGNILYGGEGKNNHFNGALDELRIYNRPLSEEEITNLYKTVI